MTSHHCPYLVFKCVRQDTESGRIVARFPLTPYENQVHKNIVAILLVAISISFARLRQKVTLFKKKKQGWIHGKTVAEGWAGGENRSQFRNISYRPTTDTARCKVTCLRLKISVFLSFAIVLRCTKNGFPQQINWDFKNHALK